MTEPLTAEERAKCERLLGPEVIRELLEKAEEHQEARATTHMDLRLHWNYGKLVKGTLSAVQATTFTIRS